MSMCISVFVILNFSIRPLPAKTQFLQIEPQLDWRPTRAPQLFYLGYDGWNVVDSRPHLRDLGSTWSFLTVEGRHSTRPRNIFREVITVLEDLFDRNLRPTNLWTRHGVRGIILALQTLLGMP
jgi:hypothetical protein